MQITIEVAPYPTRHQSMVAIPNQTSRLELGHPTSISHSKPFFNCKQTSHTQKGRSQICHSPEPEEPKVFVERN